MAFFKALFYGIWAIYFMNELYTFFNPMKQNSFARDLFNKQRENQGGKVEWKELSGEQKKSMKSFLLISAPAMICRFIGVFSFNWLFFVIWIIIGFALSPVSKELLHRASISKSGNHTILLLYTSFCSLINAAFALLVILNSYHLHINNTELFFKWFP